MNVEIVKMDNLGRGIAFVDNVITFIPKTIIGDNVNIKVIKRNKKYQIAEVINYVKRGPNYIESKCPYYLTCGGCQLQNLNYDETINYKITRIKELFNKYLKMDINPNVINNINNYKYRNKITLKVINSDIGYYENESHSLVTIKSCNIASTIINKAIKLIPFFRIKNGEVIIRNNYNDELMIIINSLDEIIIPNDFMDLKIIGIIVNKKVIYGEDHFIEKINDMYFRVSYDAFFQVNHYINEELFKLLNLNINDNDIILDLYCGVGTLGINASKKAKHVYGIELIPNAVKDCLVNAKMNKCTNMDFFCGDVAKVINNITEKINTVIIDPPRNGIDKETIDYILNSNVDKVIYIACDPDSLVRDYQLLSDKYEIKSLTLMDMFSYTYHVECVCVLNRR